MKNLFLVILLFISYSTLNALLTLTPPSETTTTEPTTPSSDLGAPTVLTQQPSVPTQQTTGMDPAVENDLLNRIFSIQYAQIDYKIKVLNNILNQAKKLGYISPSVQYNYYAAINKIFSDLMASTKREFTVYIKQFMDLLNRSSTSPILDTNQKSAARSYILQLNQQYQNLTSRQQAPKTTKGAPRERKPQVGRLR